MNDSPVICAECRDTGTIVALKDGNHLTCALCDDKPIWGSKPKWCPKQDLERIYFLRGLDFSPFVMVYDKEHIQKGGYYQHLQRWVNNRFLFWSIDDFDKYEPWRKSPYYRKIIPEV